MGRKKKLKKKKKLINICQTDSEFLLCFSWCLYETLNEKLTCRSKHFLHTIIKSIFRVTAYHTFPRGNSETTF